MSKFLLMLLLVFVSNSAMAKWIHVSGDVDNSYYVDASTIRKNEDSVKLWLLVNRKETGSDNSYRSYKVQNEFDCKEVKVRSLYTTYFSDDMGKGVVIHSKSIQSWYPIAPESVGDRLLKVACGIYTLNEAAVSDSSSNEWTLVSSTENLDVYADLSDANVKVRNTKNKEKMQKNNIVNAWTIHDYKIEQSIDNEDYISSKVLNEYDCKEGKYRIIKGAYFTDKMAAGNVIGDFDMKTTSDWIPTSPDSVANLLLNSVCFFK